jgi:tetratricopeptide (TPR) repeat protein
MGLAVCFGTGAAEAESSFAGRLQLGKNYAASGKWPQAEELFRMCRQERRDSAEATVLHAQSLVHLKQPFDAVLELQELLTTNPNDVPALVYYAALLNLMMKDNNGAEKALVKATALAPDNLEAWKALGAIYLGGSKTADAIRAFKEGVRLSPADAELFAYLGNAQGLAGNATEAEVSFSSALELNAKFPKRNANVDSLYGQYLRRQGRWRESVQAYNKALAVDPRLTEAYYGRASAYEALKEFALAEADAVRAIRQNPRDRAAHLLLLRIYTRDNQKAKAQAEDRTVQEIIRQEDAQKALGINLRSELRVAEPLLREGKFDEAKSHYESIVKMLPTFYEAYFALGICQSQLGQPERAEASLRKYLSFESLSADGHAALGVLLFQQKRYAEARPELERSVQLDATLLEPRKALAKIYASRGDWLGVNKQLEAIMTPGQPLEAEFYTLDVTALHNLGKTAEALTVCDQGLAGYPQATDLQAQYVALLRAESDAKQIKAKLELKIEQQPGSLAYTKALGEALMQDNTSNRAEELLSQAVRVFPNDAEAHYLYGKLLWLNNKLALSVAELKQAQRRDPANERANVQIETMIGVAEGDLNHLSEAESAFQAALSSNRKLKPPDPGSTIQYVEFLERHGRHEEADRLNDELLGWAPSFGAGYIERAKKLLKEGKHSEAARDGELALKYAGDNQALLRASHALLAKAYFAMHRLEEAQQHEDWIKAQQ